MENTTINQTETGSNTDVLTYNNSQQQQMQPPPLFNVTVKRTDAPVEHKFERVIVQVNGGAIILQGIDGKISVFGTMNHTLEGEIVQP